MSALPSSGISKRFLICAGLPPPMILNAKGSINKRFDKFEGDICFYALSELRVPLGIPNLISTITDRYKENDAT